MVRYGGKSKDGLQTIRTNLRNVLFVVRTQLDLRIVPDIKMLPLNRYCNHTSNTKYFLVGCVTLLIKSTLNMTLNCVTLTSIGWPALKNVV